VNNQDIELMHERVSSARFLSVRFATGILLAGDSAGSCDIVLIKITLSVSR
jgi:hypothetical protein